MAALLSHAKGSGGILRLDRQSLMKMLLVPVLGAAVLLIVHPPLPVVMALETGVMAFLCFRGAMDRPGRGEVALAVPA